MQGTEHVTKYLVFFLEIKLTSLVSYYFIIDKIIILVVLYLSSGYGKNTLTSQTVLCGWCTSNLVVSNYQAYCIKKELEVC